MKHFEFRPQMVCSQNISFDLDDESNIHNLKFFGGCNGNLKAIGKLVEGMQAEKVISLLEGNTCGPRPTSCADQLSKALRKALQD